MRIAGFLSEALPVSLLALMVLGVSGCTPGEVRAQTDSDTIKYKVRHFLGVEPLNPRSFYWHDVT